MLELALTILGFLILVFPMGWYLYTVAQYKATPADTIFMPLDKAVFALCRMSPADRSQSMDWKRYAFALLLTNAVMLFTGYTLLRFQQFLPLNPNNIANMGADLSFNTVISFMTNTNLQHYSGESGLSYFSQMLVIIFMMFTSAGTGYAACMALIRGITGMPTLGNYYVDMVRVTTRVLLPLSLLVSFFLITQGVPQTMQGTLTITTLEGKQQDIAVGPVAALESIKHLGTNGGGFLGANSTTPQENPTIFSNIAELYSMMLLPGACVVVFGMMLRSKQRESKKKFMLMGGEARSVFVAMGLIFILGLSVCYFSEKAGNPLLATLGISQDMGSMEGKEVRLGLAQSAMFTTVTTSFTTGTVNNMHDTLTPLGGMIPLLHMLLNVVFGGFGVGFMNMLLYVLLAVFLCGLMVGRTPEYLGKKVEVREMKLVMLGLIVPPLLVLGFSALAVSTTAGLAGITNPGPHGLSQVLYEYASSTANNGSGFEGLADNSFFWNITAGLAMFFGHYAPIILQLAIAGALFAKSPVNTSAGTLRTDTLTFAVSLAVMVLVFAALTFFPALALGPIAEHLTLGK